MIASTVALLLVFLLGVLLDRLDATSARAQRAFARLSVAERRAKRRAQYRMDLQRIARVWKR